VLHRGRGVTAGYPVLAVVTTRSLDVLAQARPGHTITFRRTTVPDATAKHRAALRELENLRSTVSTVFALLGIGSRPGWQQFAPAAGT
jgi:allophanate hydrolase subunit 2